MALIEGSFSEVAFTYYRDIVVRMSGLQKVQAALVPDGVNLADYEMQITEITTNGDIVYTNYCAAWVTLPTLPSFSNEFRVASCQLNTNTGSEGPVAPSTTAWFQFRLTVRKKSNTADAATGLIKLVPTVNMVSAPSSGVVAGWSGGYIGDDISVGGNPARSELELKINNSGTWSVIHKRGDSETPTTVGSGTWLPSGKVSSDFTFSLINIVGQQTTTIPTNGTFSAIPGTGFHSIRSWARKVVAGEPDDFSVYLTATLQIKEVSSGAISQSPINFENTARA